MLKFLKVFQENKKLKQELEQLKENYFKNISNDLFFSFYKLDLSTGKAVPQETLKAIEGIWTDIAESSLPIFKNENTSKALYCYLRFILFNSGKESSEIENFILSVFRKAGITNKKISEYQTYFIEKFENK
jgi:hypothetical protein